MESLERVMEKEWQQVRKGFYYPQLPYPKLDKEVPNGQLNFENLQIGVNPSYIEELAQKGCAENISFNAVLGHEVGHFMDYPGSMLTLLRMHKVAREDLDEQQAFASREAFLNVQNNTNLVLNKRYESIPAALKSEAAESKGLNKILYGLYQTLWDKKLGVRLNRKEKALIKKLQKIDYLDKESQEQNLREFIEITREHLDQYEPDHGCDSSMFSENQVREGIRQFASESQPGEFEQIVEEVLREAEEEEKEYGKGPKKQTLKQKQERQTRAFGAGTEKGELIIARNFYSALAENFSVPIKKKQMEKNGSLYPHSHEEFSLSDEVTDLDTFSSPGIIPGVTQKWIRKEGEVTTTYLGIPDSLIVIDSSGSMPNPDKGISVPVLGATVIANAYLNNNAEATIYNFSTDNIVTGPSKNKERIHTAARTYQNGGTVFSPGTIEDIVNKQGSIDISVVSDMDIHNLGDFVSYISKLPKVHRVHLFYTDSGRIESIRDELKHKGNVAIMPLYSEKDIKKIVMGELKKSIR